MARSLLVAGAILGAWIGAGPRPAEAVVAIPAATAVGTAVDNITLNGTYTAPLPTPLAQPFAASGFVLSFDVPAQMTTPILGFGNEFAYNGIAGSYSNNGQTETFTNQFVAFSNLPGGLGAMTVEISGLLAPTDSFSIFAQASAPLYTVQSGDGAPIYTLSLGSFTISGGSATYGVDPPFTGSGSTQSVTAAPEPAGLVLLLPALAGLALLRRSPRSSPGLA